MKEEDFEEEVVEEQPQPHNKLGLKQWDNSSPMWRAVSICGKAVLVCSLLLCVEWVVLVVFT